MQIAVAMAGYQPGEADGIRKAVAKKKQDLMDQHHVMFREGAVARGIDAEVADRVWADIEFFARYGFNRAHATDYAVITAQTAYLRAHYPLEFMTALMTTERHNTEKLGFLISDARRNGLTVERPSINHSEVEFTIEHHSDDAQRHSDDAERFIRIGLGAIKNVGDDAMQMVVDARRAGGSFRSLDDFADRVDLRRLNRKALECLIQAGALDDFGPRAALMTLIDTMMGMSAQAYSARDVGQFSLFDNMTDLRQSITLPAVVPPIPDRQILEWEKELLGTYLSKHPLADQERDLLKRELVTTTIGQHITEAPGQVLKLVGMIQRVRRITTKKGAMMAFLSLEAPGGTLECVVFPKTYESIKDVLTPNRVVVVCGKLDNQQDREEHSLVVEWLKEPHEFLMPTSGPVPIAGGDGFAYEDDPPPYGAPPTRNGSNGGGQMERRRAAVPSVSPEPTDDFAPENSAPARVSDLGTLRGSEMAPPPEPPAPPATLVITLKRSGDNSSDFQKLARLHKVLRRERGADQFVVVLEGDQKVELAFPNETTQCTYDLRQQITAIVGPENLRVIQQ